MLKGNKRINTDIAVIGAGPSGLMAAGWAALCGATVDLYEGNSEAGKKLLLTGNGRCNLTNNADEATFIKAFNENGRPFIRNSFRAFNNKELVSFFRDKLSIPLTEERWGKIYPSSGKAADIRNALVGWTKANGVCIHYNNFVKRLLADNNKINGILSSCDNRRYYKAVILACGGASYPTTGSNGAGYKLAKEVGQPVTPLSPALTPIIVNFNGFEKLQGLDLDDVVLSLYIDNHLIANTRGDILFAHFGLTGPAAMDLSASIAEKLNYVKHSSIEISLDSAANHSYKAVDSIFVELLNREGKKRIVNTVSEIVPDRYAAFLLAISGIAIDKLSHQISKFERGRLVSLIKGMKFPVNGVKPLDFAMATRGGIDLKFVNSHTMESKIINGLFFAGELLDIDGKTGGYNLQAAFSTGKVAGESAGNLNL